ncbi:MAG: hypothetical protein HQL29_03475 [Candidatus Omnitrophica bacterium]|nr:hypothetical protein [Candidatus Omnitrophota bacterium]
MEPITMAMIAVVAGVGAIITKSRSNSKKIDMINKKIHKDYGIEGDPELEKEIDEIIAKVK